MKNFYVFIAVLLLAKNLSAQCGTLITTTNVTCANACDGSMIFTPSSGTPPYFLSVNGSFVASFMIADTMTGVCAGAYQYLVFGAGGTCTDSGDVIIFEPTPLLTTVTVTNPTCTNGNDGTACANINGGTPPYSINWIMTGDTSLCVPNLSSGLYILFVQDANNCLDSLGGTISQSPSLSVSTVSPTCPSGNNGSLCINATGGVSPFTYSSDSGITFQTSNCFSGLFAGTYHITVADSNGCTGSIDVSISDPPPMIVDLGPDIMVCAGIQQGPFCALVAGGTQPYSYQWSTSPTDTLSCIVSAFVPGVISVLVTDSNGCTAFDNFAISVAPPISASVTHDTPSCGLCDGTATSTSLNAVTYVWTPGNITTSTLIGFCAGTLYTLTVANAFGCTDSVSFFSASQCDSVWPGDANADGIADNTDVLALGLNFGLTGPVRAGATNSWTGQFCTDWADSLANGVNAKHSDCDGNGTIEAADTLPVYLNYGLLHPRLIQPAHNSSVPDLYLESIVDSIGPSQLLKVKVHLGSAGTPVTQIYGIAFTLTFDPTLVDTTTASFDYSTSALGVPGVNLLTFQFPFYSSGAVDVAITRTDHIDAAGIDSTIAVFEVVITDNVSATDMLRMGVSNVTAITSAENPVVLNARGDSVTIVPTLAGIHNLSVENSISVFPSPVTDRIQVRSVIEIEKAELINELGEKIVPEKAIHAKTFTIGTEGVRTGIYFLQLTTASGMVRKRVCVMR